MLDDVCLDVCFFEDVLDVWIWRMSIWLDETG